MSEYHEFKLIVRVDDDEHLERLHDRIASAVCEGHGEGDDHQCVNDEWLVMSKPLGHEFGEDDVLAWKPERIQFPHARDDEPEAGEELTTGEQGYPRIRAYVKDPDEQNVDFYATDIDWVLVPTAPLGGCDHTETVCQQCITAWENDWIFHADERRAFMEGTL